MMRVKVSESPASPPAESLVRTLIVTAWLRVVVVESLVALGGTLTTMVTFPVDGSLHAVVTMY